MPPIMARLEALCPGRWLANSKTMTQAPSTSEKAASAADRAGRRYLNDQLRIKGRGGVVTVSLSLVAAGEDALVHVLQAIGSFMRGLPAAMDRSGSIEHNHSVAAPGHG